MDEVSPQRRPKIYFDIGPGNTVGLTCIEGRTTLKACVHISDNLLPINDNFLSEIKNRIAREINKALYREMRKEVFQLHTLLGKLYSHITPTSGDFYTTIDQIEECLSNIGNCKIDFDLGEDNE